MNIEDQIRRQIEMYEGFGHPAIMERFILRNGERMEIGPLLTEPGTPKECFSNATHARLRIPGSRYVEGYFVRNDLPLLIHHAWIEVDGFVMDNTILNNEDSQYFGVKIDDDILKRELQKNGVYGVLDTGMINVRLLIELDPELEAFLPDHMKGKYK